VVYLVTVEEETGLELAGVLALPVMMLHFIPRPSGIGRASHCSMPRTGAFPAPWRPIAGVSMVVLGKAVQTFALHLVLEEG
jgi:hypothetical protein